MMTPNPDPTERLAFVDDEVSADLGNGYTLAWCVRPDGERWPWLTRDDYDGDDNGTCAGAGHETTGRLPRDVAERVGALCGVPTSNGRPCRNWPDAGHRCHVHQKVDV